MSVPIVMVCPASAALLDGVDDLLESQPRAQVLLGGVALLGVHDAVGGQIDRGVARDPAQTLDRLHHGDRVLERLEVTHQ